MVSSLFAYLDKRIAKAVNVVGGIKDSNACAKRAALARAKCLVPKRGAMKARAKTDTLLAKLLRKPF